MNIVNVLDENKLVYVLATKALVQSFHLITTIHFKLVEFFGEVLVLGIDEKKNFLNGPTPASFSFIFIFSNTDYKFYNK